MIGQHMGGIPELAMALGPLLLIAVFVKIARKAEAHSDDEDDWEDWDDVASEDVAGRSTGCSDAISTPATRRR